MKYSIDLVDSKSIPQFILGSIKVIYWSAGLTKHLGGKLNSYVSLKVLLSYIGEDSYENIIQHVIKEFSIP